MTATRLARTMMRGYTMQPFTLGTLTITGVAVWTTAADLQAKAWPAMSDRWSVTLTAGTAPVAPLDYYTGTGHRRVLASRGLECLPTRPTVWQWENSSPVVPTVGALLACILSDAETYRGECVDMSDAEAADALVASGLMGDNPKPSEALALVAALRDQHRRLQALEAAGVDPDALRDALDEAGGL